MNSVHLRVFGQLSGMSSSMLLGMLTAQLLIFSGPINVALIIGAVTLMILFCTLLVVSKKHTDVREVKAKNTLKIPDELFANYPEYPSDSTARINLQKSVANELCKVKPCTVGEILNVLCKRYGLKLQQKVDVALEIISWIEHEEIVETTPEKRYKIGGA